LYYNLIAHNEKLTDKKSGLWFMAGTLIALITTMDAVSWAGRIKFPGRVARFGRGKRLGRYGVGGCIEYSSTVIEILEAFTKSV
jgi:hypothetical protein